MIANRIGTWCFGLVACGSLALVEVACAADVDLPVRKPGLWRIASISAAHGMTAIDACIGAGDSIAATTSPGTCGPPSIERAGDQVIVTVDCKSGEGRERTSTLFTGDFTTWYRGIVKMSFDPPSRGSNLGITIDAKYVGPCAPPQTGAPAAK